MTVYTYVGLTPRFLSSGRPITFGTELQESDLELADEATKAQLVDASAWVEPAKEPAPASAEPVAETPAPAEVPDPAPAEAPAEAPSLDPIPADAPAFAGRGSK